MFPNIGMNLYQWLENAEKKFTRNRKNITTVEKRKKEYSKGYDFHVWTSYATIDAFYRRLLFIEAGRIQK